MSSGGLYDTRDATLYRWSDDLNQSDYLRAVYEVTAVCDGEQAALSMAMEQSVGTTHIGDYLNLESLAPCCIRVVSVSELPEQPPSVIATYRLMTPVYEASEKVGGTFAIELAIPLRLLAGKPVQLFNILIGELPRLGFLTRFRLMSANLPTSFGPGPGFGVAGIRRLTKQARGPLLCRSMRPAVGLDIATMAQLNRDVLTGGFHIVKDDELAVFANFAEFDTHVRAMLAARDIARSETGERKLYFANLICEPWELTQRWELCCKLGVDGVLVAPWIQGWGTMAYLAGQRKMPILAHNTLGEIFTRHPDWKIDHAVVNHWLRICGADLFVTDGEFGNVELSAAKCAHQLDNARQPLNGLAAMVPILQGGKTPSGLPLYRKLVGSDDFMLIVAQWVDNHAGGLATGAAAFRRALDT